MEVGRTLVPRRDLRAPRRGSREQQKNTKRTGVDKNYTLRLASCIATDATRPACTSPLPILPGTIPVLSTVSVVVPLPTVLSEAVQAGGAQSAGTVVRFEGSNQVMLQINIDRFEINFTQNQREQKLAAPTLGLQCSAPRRAVCVLMTAPTCTHARALLLQSSCLCF
jgi:hypothetical protein